MWAVLHVRYEPESVSIIMGLPMPVIKACQMFQSTLNTLTQAMLTTLNSVAWKKLEIHLEGVISTRTSLKGMVDFQPPI